MGAPAGMLDTGVLSGKYVEQFVAGATLLIGDVVFFDPATSRVNKSLTLGDYDSAVGVVVGGRKTFGQILQDTIDIGEQAAVVGEEVLVAWGGIVKCISDAAIANGDRVAAATATTAGRVKTSVATNFVIGVALAVAGGAGIVIPVFVSMTKTAMT